MSFLRNLLLLGSGALALGCDKTGQDTVKADQYYDAPVLSCLMTADKTCSEFQAQTVNGLRYTVNSSSAQTLCSEGWNGSGNAGVFDAVACPTDDAIARCRREASYIELDYYYTGFADTDTIANPLTKLATACEAQSGMLEVPPFAD
jgi:hypothetical protein